MFTRPLLNFLLDFLFFLVIIFDFVLDLNIFHDLGNIFLLLMVYVRHLYFKILRTIRHVPILRCVIVDFNDHRGFLNLFFFNWFWQLHVVIGKLLGFI